MGYAAGREQAHSMLASPNILIFCTDEQRGDHLGCMGHPDLHTPNLDRLAAEGSLFRNCYSSSPVCMAARATMFTGLTNRANGVYSNGVALDKGIPTLPGILADAGYRTHSVGKLHLQPWGGRTIADGEDTRINPERRMYWKWPGHWEGGIYTKAPDDYYGFQTQDAVMGHVNYVYGDYVTWLEQHHPGIYEDGYRYRASNPGPLEMPEELHYNHWIADRAMDFLTSRAGAGGRQAKTPPEPFFLWCSFPDPHEPFAAVRRWSDYYRDVDVELPAHTLSLSPDNRSETMCRMGKGTEVYEPDWIKACIRQTYGMISHVDEQVGRVLARLDKLGLADNTIVMFVSDHGDQLGEHGLLYKMDYPYNAHMHVPFLAKVPNGVQGQVVDDVVSQLDLVPTVLHLAGVQHPDDVRRAQVGSEPMGVLPAALPGEVLAPVLRGGGRPQRRTALVEHDTVRSGFETIQFRTLVTNDYKLVFYTPLQETMLFDRKNDPDEIQNLAEDPLYQAVVRDLLQQLLAEVARTEMRAHCQTTCA